MIKRIPVYGSLDVYLRDDGGDDVLSLMPVKRQVLRCVVFHGHYSPLYHHHTVDIYDGYQIHSIHNLNHRESEH